MTSFGALGGSQGNKVIGLDTSKTTATLARKISLPYRHGHEQAFKVVKKRQILIIFSRI